MKVNAIHYTRFPIHLRDELRTLDEEYLVVQMMEASDRLPIISIGEQYLNREQLNILYKSMLKGRAV